MFIAISIIIRTGIQRYPAYWNTDVAALCKPPKFLVHYGILKAIKPGLVKTDPLVDGIMYRYLSTVESQNYKKYYINGSLFRARHYAWFDTTTFWKWSLGTAEKSPLYPDMVSLSRDDIHTIPWQPGKDIIWSYPTALGTSKSKSRSSESSPCMSDRINEVFIPFLA